MLAALLGASWLWQSNQRASVHPEVDPSTAGWIDQGKVTPDRAQLDRLRGALLEHETLEHDELERRLGTVSPVPKKPETLLGPVVAPTAAGGGHA